MMQEQDINKPSHPFLKKGVKLDLSAPEGYFDGLADEVLNQAKEVEMPIEKKSGSSSILLWSIAAGIAVLLGLFLFLSNEAGTDQAELIAGYESVEDYLIEDDDLIEELYIETLIAEEQSITLDYLLEDLEEESFEELYIQEL